MRVIILSFIVMLFASCANKANDSKIEYRINTEELEKQIDLEILEEEQIVNPERIAQQEANEEKFFESVDDSFSEEIEDVTDPGIDLSESEIYTEEDYSQEDELDEE